MSRSSLLKGTLVLTLGMALGRMSGFLRELVMASYLGVSSLADAVIVSLTLPDLLIALLVGGAANIVLIPLFQKSKREHEAELFWTMSFVSFFIFSALAGIALAFPEALMSLMAPGLDMSQLPSARSILLFSLLAIPLVGWTSVSRALLQAHSRFLTTSLEGFFTNLGIIVGCLMVPFFSFQSILIGLLVGSLLRWGTQMVDALKLLPQATPQFSKVHLNRPLMVQYAQALGAGTLVLAIPLLARTFGSLDGSGAIALFNYSSKFLELPLGMVITVFSIVLFPTVSRLLQTQRREEAKEVIDVGLASIFTTALPLTLGLMGVCWLFRELPSPSPVIADQDFKRLCDLVMIGAVVLPFRGLSSYHLALFAALGDLKSPAVISAVFFAVSSLAFYGLGLQFGLFGVMIGLSAVYFLMFVSEVLVLIFKHHVPVLAFLNHRRLAYSVATSLILSTSLIPLRELAAGSHIKTVLISMLFGVMLLAVAGYFNISWFQRLRRLKTEGRS